MVLFGILGLFQVIMYWDGLIAWLHFCGLPYAQVKGTPYEEIWTSLRAVTGIFFLTIILIFFLTDRRRENSHTEKTTEQDAAPNSRPPQQLPTSPEAQPSDSQRTSASGGCG